MFLAGTWHPARVSPAQLNFPHAHTGPVLHSGHLMIENRPLTWGRRVDWNGASAMVPCSIWHINPIQWDNMLLWHDTTSEAAHKGVTITGWSTILVPEVLSNIILGQHVCCVASLYARPSQDCILFLMAWKDVIFTSKWQVIFCQLAGEHNFSSVNFGFFLWSCVLTKDYIGRGSTDHKAAPIIYAKLKTYSVPLGYFLQQIEETWFFPGDFILLFLPGALFPRAFISPGCMRVPILHGYLCDPMKRWV